MQILQHIEAAAAHLTTKRLLSGVNDRVGLELCLFGETLAALRTLIRPLASVRPHVTMQTLPLTESTAADFAGEQLLVRVEAVMRRQAALRCEGFIAQFAHEVFPRDVDKLLRAGNFLLEVRGHRLSSFNSSSWRRKCN